MIVKGMSKYSFPTMLLSYLLLLSGLFMWDWGRIPFLSVFRFGLPMIILLLPPSGCSMARAKSQRALCLRFVASLFSCCL